MAGKFIVGKIYKIRFYDHATGTEELIICEVCGWVLKDNPLNVVLTSWVVDTKDAQVKKDNVEPMSILKSTIIRSRKFS